MKKFKVVLGLGRMASHHIKEFNIEAPNQSEAKSIARSKYYDEVGKEIGPKAPIWGKMLTIESCEEIA